ncbi:staygreen family protein [Pseudobacillus sp. FSL P4-0506]|uniref:staygreen family protein n=1 Tax=unclassified Pseudobacillus TaxID=2619284 RepID=UPI0030F7202F
MFDLQKLFVQLTPPATFVQPAEGRKYTLTHSDVTAKLFLDVGYVYNCKAINWKMRDEVLAEWKKDWEGRLYLAGKAYVDSGEFRKEVSGLRFNLFQKEIGTAITGIVYGDWPFYYNYPALLDAPIFVYYDSTYPEYSHVFYYGTPRQYVKQISSGFRLARL